MVAMVAQEAGLAWCLDIAAVMEVMAAEAEMGDITDHSLLSVVHRKTLVEVAAIKMVIHGLAGGVAVLEKETVTMLRMVCHNMEQMAMSEQIELELF